MKKCLVIGAAMLDIVMQIDELPKKGEDVYAKSQTMTVGGCAYNVADIMKHFAVPYTLFAPIGTGMYASMIREKLKQAEHESPIESTKMDNGYCLCMVESDGERTFLTLPGIECTFEKEWFDALDVTEYDSVYICGYEIEGDGGDQIIDFLEKNRDLDIYYAPGPRITYISGEKHNRIMKLHPVLHLNEKEAIDFTGCGSMEEAATKLEQMTDNRVIITVGSKGAYLQENGHGMLIPSEKAAVVDTIGAGDSNIGAVISAVMCQKSFEAAVAVANRVSAAVVGVEGPSISEEEFQQINF